MPSSTIKKLIFSAMANKNPYMAQTLMPEVAKEVMPQSTPDAFYQFVNYGQPSMGTTPVQGVVSPTPPNVVVTGGSQKPNPQTTVDYKNLGAVAQEKNIDNMASLQKDAMSRLVKVQELIPILDQFDSMLSTVPMGTGMKGRLQGLTTGLSTYAQNDPFATTIKSQVTALRPQIARGFGDVGNLSETEQKTAQNFIPALEDADDVRALKSIGGYAFIKGKIEDQINRFGLEGDPMATKQLKMVDEKLYGAISKAAQLGIDKTKLSKFLTANKIPTAKIDSLYSATKQEVKQVNKGIPQGLLNSLPAGAKVRLKSGS